jgi:hypothetical protein
MRKKSPKPWIHALFPYIGASVSGFIWFLNNGWAGGGFFGAPVTVLGFSAITCIYLSLIGLFGYFLRLIFSLDDLTKFFNDQWIVGGITAHCLTGLLPLILFRFAS